MTTISTDKRIHLIGVADYLYATHRRNGVSEYWYVAEKLGDVFRLKCPECGEAIFVAKPLTYMKIRCPRCCEETGYTFYDRRPIEHVET